MSNLLSALTAEGEGYGYKIFGLSQRLSPISFTPTTSSPLPIKRASQLRLFVSAKDNRSDSPLQSPLTTGIVFIDSNIDDYQTLLAGVKPGLEVVLLDGNRDGIVQITEVLQKHRGLLSLHIVAHGKVGGLWLGSGFFSNNTFDQYINDVASWRTALAPDGDILLYGCNVAAGETGREFVQRLSELTGADVAASDDLTGSAELGGDWDLEVQVGDIEAALAFRVEVMEDYGGVLSKTRTVSFARPNPSIPTADQLVFEGSTNTDIPIKIHLSHGGNKRSITVPIYIDPRSTATLNEDYTLSQTSVRFPAFVSNKNRDQYVNLTIKPDDMPENNETIVLRLGEPETKGQGPNPSIGELPQAVITIAANDPISYGFIDGDSGNNILWTKYTNNTINGGAGNDTIYGGTGNDLIDGGADNDTIYGNQGNNTIYGGTGNDVINSGNGNDVIDGGADDDIIYGGGGNNIINGGTGNDTIFSDYGKDIINGGDGNDTIYSATGNDCITGGAGNDIIYAGAGDDLINGGIGDDILWLGGGRDTVILESANGTDTINGFQLGQTTFHLGAGLNANNLTFSDTTNGAAIDAGIVRIAVVSGTQASVIQNNLATIFI
ncbi:MAG TPA: hypothetical protein DEG17_26155 [Cyanobacteria bacterium UBA11149]|nr:hypothetical protein [Cyanobacteria bacterium UBA11166]HBR76078.1 hypothetical protein [Cyanobacteria bacterium UBA11159]HBS69510.1 hypothetical protein [Cyanobacteria bacterium UBA11153]HBW92253.1 hypothetical protein [Cyanobacteria bacterium UBA11149]HCA93842.1 hypothetical protein [Cyanobacteria bacterium UBA9226]